MVDHPDRVADGVPADRRRVRAAPGRARPSSSWSTSATRARSRSAPSTAPSTIPVGQLPGRLDELDPTAPTVVFCAGGYRSSVAASVLRQAGFADVSDILGGYGAWTEMQAV